MNTYNPSAKQIGSYLIDAGLLDAEQVQLALNDQLKTGAKFGDIVVSRGWIKKQTLEYVIEKVMTIERTMGRPIEKQLFENTVRARKARESGSLTPTQS